MFPHTHCFFLFLFFLLDHIKQNTPSNIQRFGMQWFASICMAGFAMWRFLWESSFFVCRFYAPPLTASTHLHHSVSSCGICSSGISIPNNLGKFEAGRNLPISLTKAESMEQLPVYEKKKKLDTATTKLNIHNLSKLFATQFV